MRTNRTPEFSFDDSLKPYNRRQKLATQSQSGNYAWTAIRAGLLAVVGSDFAEASISAADNTVLELLLFGSDTPAISFISGYDGAAVSNQQALLDNFAAIQTYMDANRVWALAVNAAVPALPAPPAAPVLDPVGAVAALAGIGTLYRPSALLGPGWNQVQTDLGAGVLVRATGGTGPTAKIVQGFPQAIRGKDLLAFGDSVTVDKLEVTVMFEGGVIHGQNGATPSGGNLNPQPGYIPCIVPRDFYTAAIYTAGNVFEQGGNRYVVMGLWQNYVEGP